MNNTITLLERIRLISEPQSKNEVARRCNIPNSSIRGMYKGTRYPNAMQMVEISKILRIDMGAIASYIAEDKAKSAHTKAEARSRSPRLHPALGLAIATAAGIMLFSYNDVQESDQNIISPHNDLYIMRSYDDLWIHEYSVTYSHYRSASLRFRTTAKSVLAV